MLNVGIVQGRICADPELRHTPNDIAVASFTIANDQGNGDKKKTSFIDVVCWRGTAELVCKWFKKGSAIIVQGSIQTRTYTDKDGNKRKAFEVVANNVHFAEKKESNNNTYQRGSADVEPARGDTGDFEEMPVDDDLPF
ncbi:single-stranded DNA-binding protein [Caproiciproducens sp.]